VIASENEALDPGFKLLPQKVKKTVSVVVDIPGELPKTFVVSDTDNYLGLDLEVK
jgi:uncharacterized protein (DUF1499 family)